MILSQQHQGRIRVESVSKIEEMGSIGSRIEVKFGLKKKQKQTKKKIGGREEIEMAKSGEKGRRRRDLK